MHRTFDLSHIAICSALMLLVGPARADSRLSNSSEKICSELLIEAHALFDNLDYKRSMEKYRLVSELCPTSDRYYWLADAYYKSKMCKEAYSVLLKISENQLTKDVTINKYQDLLHRVQTCNSMVEYKFKAAKIVDDLNIEINAKVTVGQDSCITPCSMILAPRETIIDFENLYNKRIKLGTDPTTLVYYEKKNKGIFYAGLPTLIVGALSLAVGIVLSAGDFPITEDIVTDFGSQSGHQATFYGWYRTTGLTLIGMGAVLTTTGGIAVGLGNKSSSGVSITSTM